MSQKLSKLRLTLHRCQGGQLSCLLQTAILALAAGLVACGFPSGRFSGTYIVLSDSQTLITSSPHVWEMSVENLGDVYVCVVLRDNLPEVGKGQMDEIYLTKMGDASLTAELISETGDIYVLGEISKVWNLEGPITTTSELAACATSRSIIPQATVFVESRLKAIPNMSVRGVYVWTTERPAQPED